MKNVLRLIIAIGLAFFVTAPKLYKMCQIRGWVSGAVVTQETITQKWNQTPEEHYKGRDVYWIAWSETDIRTVGDHRVNLVPEMWRKLDVGDKINVIRIPGDASPYLRNGIYASTGNFIFDVVLLIVEVGVAAFSIGVLVGGRSNESSDDNSLVS